MQPEHCKAKREKAWSWLIVHVLAMVCYEYHQDQMVFLNDIHSIPWPAHDQLQQRTWFSRLRILIFKSRTFLPCVKKFKGDRA